MRRAHLVWLGQSHVVSLQIKFIIGVKINFCQNQNPDYSESVQVPGIVAREAEDGDAPAAGGQPRHEEVWRRLVHVVHGQGDHSQVVLRGLLGKLSMEDLEISFSNG